MIKKMIRRIINWACTDEPEKEKAITPSRSRLGLFISNTAVPTGPSDEDLEYAKRIDLRIYRANGGTIIQTFGEDQRNNNKIMSTLYVITGDQNLGEELEQIITRESLSR